MSELMDIIKGRRSMRKFEDRPVPEDKLQEILEAVQWAPSWANTQVWEVVVIRDNERKTRIQETLAPKNPATKAVVAAPILLALCAKLKSSGYYDGQVTTKHGDWYMFDLGIAAQNLCLMAHSLGLATVIVGLFDHDRAAKEINLPEGHELVALIPLGYPAKQGAAPPRKEIDRFTHQETF